MIGLLWFALALLVSPFRSTARLEAENAVLRQQLIVLGRTCRGRARLTNSYRLVFVQLYRWFPSIIRSSRSSGRRRSFGGIALGFAATGAGGRAIAEGGPRSMPS